MEYEPQSMSTEEMDKRLESLQQEFLAVINKMNDTNATTEEILQAVDKRINKDT